MISAIRVQQHLIAVIAAKASQGLLRGKTLQLGKGKQLARAGILALFIHQFTILKAAGVNSYITSITAMVSLKAMPIGCIFKFFAGKVLRSIFFVLREV